MTGTITNNFWKAVNYADQMIVSVEEKMYDNKIINIAVKIFACAVTYKLYQTVSRTLIGRVVYWAIALGSYCLSPKQGLMHMRADMNDKLTKLLTKKVDLQLMRMQVMRMQGPEDENILRDIRIVGDEYTAVSLKWKKGKKLWERLNFIGCTLITAGLSNIVSPSKCLEHYRELIILKKALDKIHSNNNLLSAIPKTIR